MYTLLGDAGIVGDLLHRIPVKIPFFHGVLILVAQLGSRSWPRHAPRWPNFHVILNKQIPASL